MALRSAARGGNHLNCGSGSSIDNLSTMTYVVWINITATTANDYGLAGNGTFALGNRKDFFYDTSANTFGLVVDRATTDTDVVGDWTAATGWHYFAVVDPGAGSTPRALFGTLTTTAAEPSYTKQQTGVGTVGDSSARNFLVGNIGLADRSPIGNIAFFQCYNRGLSNAEIQLLQWFRRPLSGCVLWVEPGYNGTGTTPDYSGNGNAGTVVGTLTVADHVPLAPPFGISRGWKGAYYGGNVKSLSAAAAGAATAGSADNAVRGVYATAAGAAIASASDNVVRALGTVTVAGTGAAAAPMSVVRVLQATASGAATATATFSGTVRSLSATVTSVATAAATMAAIRAILAQAAGAGVASAQVSRLAIREAAVGGLSTAAANVALIRSLGTIQAAGSASASAAVNVIRALSALAAASGVAAADLDIAGAAAATTGKYAAEHAQAYRMVLAAEQDDYTSEHARAYRDVFEAGA